MKEIEKANGDREEIYEIERERGKLTERNIQHPFLHGYKDKERLPSPAAHMRERAQPEGKMDENGKTFPPLTQTSNYLMPTTTI